MEPGDTALGQGTAPRSRDTLAQHSNWQQDPSALTAMSTFGSHQSRQASQTDLTQLSSAMPVQPYSSGKLQVSAEGTQQLPERQYQHHFPSNYPYQQSLSFPQQSLPQRFLHSTKPQRSLEEPSWQFSTQLQSVTPEDVFSVHSQGQTGVFPRKKAAFGQYPQKSVEQSEDSHKKELKPKKPGKYICHYCGRACAKPSVLKKHIRSHTGERPYPCVPCGFSFKTKSNLYKHRKSHAHAIKAGLVTLTDISSKAELDDSFTGGEPEFHSDGDQSTDTDEENTLGVTGSSLSEKGSHTLQLSYDTDKNSLSKRIEMANPDFQLPTEESAVGAMKVPILIVPKSRLHSKASQFTKSELLQSTVFATKVDEPHTVKQRLALILTEKRDQDSEQSLNLLSPHSKGSTDSGYFSRSESADQQVSPPNTNAKSYEEIMFGKYYRPNPRSSVSVSGVTAVSQEGQLMDKKDKTGSLPVSGPKVGMNKIIEEHISQLITNNEVLVDPSKINTVKPRRLSRGDSSDSQKSVTVMGPGRGETQLLSGTHNTAGLLLEMSETSPLSRSNSMPTSSATSLCAPQSLRGSHSFDERMSNSDDVFYPGTVGLPPQRMLRRQAAFELSCTQEGHSDSDQFSKMAKAFHEVTVRSPGLDSGLLSKERRLQGGDRSIECDICGASLKKWDELDGHKMKCREIHSQMVLTGIPSGGESYYEFINQQQLMHYKGTVTPETRKRRKEKSVGDEEDVPMLCSSGPVLSDYGAKSSSQEGAKSLSGSTGYDFSVHSQTEYVEVGRSFTGSPATEDLDQEKTSDSSSRKPQGNVISVIQHTNSLSRPSSFERTESTELITCPPEKSVSHSEPLENEITDSTANPECIQQLEGADPGHVPSSSQEMQQYHIQPKLVRQNNIQVPEIRVTEEPDKPVKELEVQQPKEQEKPPEEFQWPQRSETLSQLPAEKLPPKKKRLRLADMEYSSGESSFDSTCTSLSRSPSQESNLSHSSSLSMSFDREETLKAVTPSRPDESGKQSEFLTVPGGTHSLFVPGHHQKEMRRSSSEQIPCQYPTEIPDVRSKSFDYGNLSHSSALGSSVASSSPRERRRCFLVRQASLSVHPEAHIDPVTDQNAKQEQLDHMQVNQQPTQVPWHHSVPPSLHSVASGDSGQQTVGPLSCVQPLSSLHCIQQHVLPFDVHQEMFRSPLTSQKSSVCSQQSLEQKGQPSLLHYPEKVQLPLSYNNLPRLPYSVACETSLPVHSSAVWPQCSEAPQGHLPYHFSQKIHKFHIKPSSLQVIQQESHHAYQVDESQESMGKKSAIHSQSRDQIFPRYSGASPPQSKSPLAKTAKDHTSSTVACSMQHPQPLFPAKSADALHSTSDAVVPVRLQTHVPSYGSIMYTSVSQIVVTHARGTSSAIVICKVDENINRSTLATSAGVRHVSLNLAQMLSHHGGLVQYPMWKVPETLPVRLDSAVPLCLPSTTDATSTLGGSKRMLSPASSLELFVETKQQKRVKDEKMYGQIVEEMSAVELDNSNIKKEASRSQKPLLVRQYCTTESKDSPSSLSSSSSPSSSQDFSAMTPPAVDCISETIQSHLESGRTLSGLKGGSGTSDGRDSPEELDIDETTSEMSLSPQQHSLTPCDIRQKGQLKQHPKLPVTMLVQFAANQSGAVLGSTILLTDVADVQQFLQFPSLRTTTGVSWCFLNYTKPNHAHQTTVKSSVYASWCISSYNPNPPGMNTKVALALLRSKQSNTSHLFSMAAMYRPGTGKLTSSGAWNQQVTQQVKPELSLQAGAKAEKKLVGSVTKERTKAESHGDKDGSAKQGEPTRIKIFEGGYKSNEDYVYVRGRGRGKYICEECGIRCKKPSMLKKHIRTHTDVRPYVCKFCNFAFKTKGNLTKHMKSKAHMKKCLELGVSVTSVDDAEIEESETTEEMQKDVTKAGMSTEHQFSDADDSDVAEEEGDDIDDDEDEDDESEDHQGDLTPKTRSRSTSPQPPRFSSLSVTAASHITASESTAPPSLMNYFVTLPSIQVTQLMAPSDMYGDRHVGEYQRLLQGGFPDSEPDKDRLDVPSFTDDEYMPFSETSSSPRDLSPSRYTCSSRQSSPGYDSSPCRDSSPKRYLSPGRDLSPRTHFSPRRDLSPMRHLSPKRDVFRQDLSPRRELSPRRHLSPRRDTPLGRPVSPGKDILTRRELSPRRERRFMPIMRAASPRRISCHSSGWPMGHCLPSDSLPWSHTLKPHPEIGMNLKKGVPQAPYCGVNVQKEGGHGHQSLETFAEGRKDYVFSHLPLHSQHQVRASLPMIPIGGIQMVHSVPSTLSGLHPTSKVTLNKSSSEEKSPANTTGESSVSSQQDTGATRQVSGLTLSSVDSSRFEITKQKSSDGIAEFTWRTDLEEEGIQTCVKAIASLKIASEEAGTPGKSQRAHVYEHQKKALESAQTAIKHFSGFEASQEKGCISATKPDMHSEKENLGTSQPALGHSPQFSKNGENRRLGLGSSNELHSQEETSDLLSERNKVP
ncbi:transcription factor HIVEP2 [Protopterus annectens]|uniref:transcription factor HIVEP2 n=1 Tax=Protopterus annectens TaxID=7888 RepID=UPI001CF95EDB|nr:transcription factor HIVEP2 [Protopterus annectens]XP_043916018.1 transcription factor HIVEP2 [Protopterus annectens]